MLDELSRWRLRSLGASIDLLNVFLGNSHDKTIAESIGLAVLDVAKSFRQDVIFCQTSLPNGCLQLGTGINYQPVPTP